MHRERRKFLQQSGLATLVAAVELGPVHVADGQDGSPPTAQAEPELIVVNAVAYTMDQDRPTAAGFAVKHGRFVATGSTEQMRALAGKRSRLIDAEGATITPGFIDAHTHPASAGVSELRNVNCDVRTIAEIKAAMKQRAGRTPAGRWVNGFKYDDTKLKDGRPLHREDLDQAVPDHPARVTHRGGHTAIYNSVAFRLAAVDRNTPDPSGGQFGRDANGELSGFVAEKAKAAFEAIAPEPPISRADRREGVKLISELMSAAGLTSVHDASTSADSFTAYQDALAAGELKFRVYAMLQQSLFERLKQARIRTGFGNNRLRIGGLKLFCDGSCSERTMRMSTPYEGRPDYFGILTMNQRELDEIATDAHTSGFQVGVHANGDVAIAMVLETYERMLQRYPQPDARPRIEHCTLVNPELLRRMAALGAIPTPFYTYVHYHGNKWAAYGQDRLHWMFAHRSFLDHGIRVAGASDYVPGPYEPLMAIQSMVTRTDFEGRVWGENQRISVEEALRICTMHGAYASFEEHEKGSITPGKLADFVILEDDPHKVAADQIKHIKIRRTVVGGEMVA